MKKVAVICPIYNRFPEIISSMINQTHKDWNLLLIHDGPNSTGTARLVEFVNDNRIKYVETHARQGLWGHPIRKWAIENIDILSPGAEYILVTNDDNFHTSNYLEDMLKGFEKDIKAVYCSKFVHSYLSNQEDGTYTHGVMNTRLELGWIDCACVLMRKEVAVESGWNDLSHSSDWTYFQRVIDKYGEESFKKVLGCLVVHA